MGGPAITDSPVDYDQVDGDAYKQKGVSDFSESRISLQSTTQFAHGEDTGNYGVDVIQDGKIEGERIALTNSIRARYKTTSHRQRTLMVTVGFDIIEFDILSVENKENSGGRPRPKILRSLHHNTYST